MNRLDRYLRNSEGFKETDCRNEIPDCLSN